MLKSFGSRGEDLSMFINQAALVLKTINFGGSYGDHAPKF